MMYDYVLPYVVWLGIDRPNKTEKPSESLFGAAVHTVLILVEQELLLTVLTSACLRPLPCPSMLD